MKIIYYDCYAGMSGDMNLGALIDLGVPADYLCAELKKLSLDFKLDINRVERSGIGAVKVNVNTPTGHFHRHLSDIAAIIDGSTLSAFVKEKSKAVFDKLATAEAKVHGTSKESIHFHEVGAVDAIVDIVGSAIALDFLKPDMITASSIQVGGGFVECAHGKLPVPAPATAELLNGVPIKSGLAQCELTTPTGAAIITSFTDNFTDSISFRSERIGYGAGSNILDFPNLLRVYLGDTADTAANPVQILLETNIDDMNPEYYSLAEEKLFEAGALDVYKTFIVMKKGRLAIKLSVLVSQEAEKKVTDAIFKHTTSIGLRRQAVHKIALDRQVETVNTEYGAVRIKCAYVDGQKANCKPEYSDCLELANKHNLPIATIYQAVLYCMRSEK